MSIAPDILERIAAAAGPGGAITDPVGMEPYLVEERGLFRSATQLIARPATTEAVAQVVRVCAEHDIAIVPQGGNTGLVGGAVTPEDRPAILLNLGRMNRVRALDPVEMTMTVEAGCVLAEIQRAAEDAGCLFPLSLGAEGSCQIGGNLATNAGGVNVLRYGNARDLVLGLETVLPDGRVWNDLKRLRKDNTGYDLKQLFIGGEGTLGIITAAVLKLFPRPAETETALAALEDLEAVLALLARMRSASGEAVTAFELIPRIALELGTKHVAGVADPFDAPHGYYCLIELSSARPDGGLREVLETGLGAAIEEGLVSDAVIAESLDQRAALWRIRETIPEAQTREGGSIKHDVSVPVAAVPAFIREASAAVQAAMPGIRPVPFGHVGDGNIHFNLTQPPGMERKKFIAEWGRMNRIVHDIVVAMEGSISAEHGIGRLKRDELAHYGDPVGLDLMRRIKQVMDPRNIMNPGKII